MRRAKLPGRGLPALPQLHGSVSQPGADQEDTSANTGHRLSAAGVQTARAQLQSAPGGAASILHRPQYHQEGSDRKLHCLCNR